MQDDVAGRILLAQRILREGLQGMNAALAAQNLPPIAPEEKRALWAATEEGVWALPEDVFADMDPASDAWLADALDHDEVRRLLERAIEAALAARAKR
ncbi:MAG TPA: hypothetical protein VM889_06490 [Candidatus Thermoplasmatota archaeon]|nr:hypothetical protein [Candidatus Thermoplasmatota archaeon]